MADPKLESFKIGDSQRPTITSPKKADESDKPESYSVGFKRLEGILEDETHESVSQMLNQLMDSLSAFAKEAKSKKDQAAAKKAIVAVERTSDLMEYLFQTKAQMQAADTK